jgi:hypothetical protein
MNSGRADGGPASKHTAPKPSVEELTELVRDLYELLQGYAPWWSTKGMDTRVSETLARFTPPRRFPQDVDQVRTTATLKDEVLEILMPKVAAALKPDKAKATSLER